MPILTAYWKPVLFVTALLVVFGAVTTGTQFFTAMAEAFFIVVGIVIGFFQEADIPALLDQGKGVGEGAAN